MTVSYLTQEMKRHAMLLTLATNHNNPKIANFLKVGSSFVLKGRKELETYGGDVSPMTRRNKYSPSSDVVKMAEFIQKVLDIIYLDSSKSMRIFVEQSSLSEMWCMRISCASPIYWWEDTSWHEWLGEIFSVSCSLLVLLNWITWGVVEREIYQRPNRTRTRWWLI